MNNELCHHGILGMKGGVRRYQNKDGSLTSAGEKRYGSHSRKAKLHRLADQLDNEAESLRAHGYHGEAASVQKKSR